MKSGIRMKQMLMNCGGSPTYLLKQPLIKWPVSLSNKPFSISLSAGKPRVRLVEQHSRDSTKPFDLLNPCLRSGIRNSNRATRVDHCQTLSEGGSWTAHPRLYSLQAVQWRSQMPLKSAW